MAWPCVFGNEEAKEMSKIQKRAISDVRSNEMKRP